MDYRVVGRFFALNGQLKGVFSSKVSTFSVKFVEILIWNINIVVLSALIHIANPGRQDRVSRIFDRLRQNSHQGIFFCYNKDVQHAVR